MIVIAILFIVLTLSACGHNENDFDGDLIMIRAILYRGPREIYLFDLRYDGILAVLSGDRYVDDFTDPKNIDIVKSDNIVISEDQLLLFNQKIHHIQNSEFDGGFARGAWNVILICVNETYRFSYGRANDEIFDGLISMLIELAPFEIRDNAGRAVKPIVVN